VGGALARAPIYKVGGGAGGRASERNWQRRWCAIMGMKAAVSEGDRPGWWWGVMRGGGCSGRYESGSGVGRRRAHMRWRQRQRVRPRRKTTRRGPCVSERVSSWMG
jgi:hypothetical protein